MGTILIGILVLFHGQPVHNAWIWVSDEIQTGFYIEQLTDSRGCFIVEVPPGMHTLTVTKPGFKQLVQDIDTDTIVELIHD